MRFNLVDRIAAWEAGKSLRGVKNLALGEEYLADHFPTFPVMPGVLMLQSLAEAGAWLWRATTDFRHAVIVLREARNVKYGTFMPPGHRMDIAVELTKFDDATAAITGKATRDDGQTTVSARVTLVGYDLADRAPEGKAIDDRLKAHGRERFAWLTGKLTGGK